MTPTEIAVALDALAEQAEEIGAAMGYFGGFSEYMPKRGAELVGAAGIMREWAENIRAEIQEGQK